MTTSSALVEDKRKAYIVHPKGNRLALGTRVGAFSPDYDAMPDVALVDIAPSKKFTQRFVLDNHFNQYIGERVTDDIKVQITHSLHNAFTEASGGISAGTASASYNFGDTTISGAAINRDTVSWTVTDTSITGTLYYSELEHGAVLSSDSTGTVTVNVCTDGRWHTQIVPSREQIKQEIRHAIQSNLLIKIGKRSRDHIPMDVSVPELRARDTLRDMITEKEWRRYVTNGFVMVKGNRSYNGSQYWYQIFSDTSKRILVYKDNKHVHNLCIHSDKSCPPSDHVINMKILAEIDEKEIWNGSNINHPSKYNWNNSNHSPVNILSMAERLKQVS